MGALPIEVPYPVFTDLNGNPLDNGSIYIGAANLDPVTNPIQVYFDDALTIPASQPLKTSNGYVYRNGTPAQLYVNGVNFSILVNDDKGLLVYSFPDVENLIVRGDPAAPKWNLFIGTGAGAATTTAARSTAVGVNALAAQTTANLNTAFGSLTLQSATTGAVNSAFGADALSATTTGEYNDGFGCKALTNNVTGSRNKAFGQSALLYNNSGNDNCAFGQSALLVNFSGSRNCSFGNNSLTSNVSGVDNSAFGSNALYYNTASYNCAFGKDAMFTNGSGASNNAIGYQSLYSNTTGNNNAALGQGTLYGNTVGTDNTGLGHRAGYGAAGDEATTVDTYCTFIGSYASRSSAVPTATVLTNATAIGYNAKFTKSNQVSLGDNLVTEIRAPGPGFLASTTDFTLSKTSTAGGTTGAQTINKPAGSVNFAAAATSLVVTNSLVTANSVIIATVATNDSTMKSVAAVAGSGSFTLHANAAATAETRVSFLVIN